MGKELYNMVFQHDLAMAWPSLTQAHVYPAQINEESGRVEVLLSSYWFQDVMLFDLVSLQYIMLCLGSVTHALLLLVQTCHSLSVLLC